MCDVESWSLESRELERFNDDVELETLEVNRESFPSELRSAHSRSELPFALGNLRRGRRRAMKRSSLAESPPPSLNNASSAGPTSHKSKKIKLSSPHPATTDDVDHASPTPSPFTRVEVHENGDFVNSATLDSWTKVEKRKAKKARKVEERSEVRCSLSDSSSRFS